MDNPLELVAFLAVVAMATILNLPRGAVSIRFTGSPRRTPRARRKKDPGELTSQDAFCGCGHLRAMHSRLEEDIGDERPGRCSERSMGATRDCSCQGYDGPQPLNGFYP